MINLNPELFQLAMSKEAQPLMDAVMQHIENNVEPRGQFSPKGTLRKRVREHRRGAVMGVPSTIVIRRSSFLESEFE